MVYDDRYKRIFNSDLLEGAKRDGKYGFSTIHVTHARPQRLISFDKALSCKDHDQWVHGYIPDPLLQRLWHNPWRYLDLFQRYEGAISPDFSVPIHLPPYVQLGSVANSRAIGSWLQRCGVDVIPNVRWGLRDTYEFAFDGIEPGGTIAVGTLGCMKDPELRRIFSDGIPELLRRISPEAIVVYGTIRDDVFDLAYESGVEILPFDSRTALVWKEA